ncbi:DUF436 family protein, partial [Bacillus altitudinis]|uniref:DUF436 family protein n=1 Tax=Bacillus altitudinis TaxID=293387 RepID=UPI003B5235A3
MQHPLLLQSISPHPRIHIPHTFIRIHLNRLALPLPLTPHQLAQAHLTFPKTPPNLIPRQRPVYTTSYFPYISNIIFNHQHPSPFQYSPFHKKQLHFPKKTFTFYSKTL